MEREPGRTEKKQRKRGEMEERERERESDYTVMNGKRRMMNNNTRPNNIAVCSTN